MTEPASRRRPLLRRLSLGTALAASALTAAPAFSARPVNRVEISGSEFISEAQIRAACDLKTGYNYSPADLAEIELCLQQTGAFASASARRQGDTLQITVKELNDRPGRLQFGIGYDSADGLYGSLLYERYNLLPGVFGGMELRLSEDLRSVDSYLYAKGALGSWDLGLDSTLREVRGSDYGFTHRQFSFEPYVARELSPGTRMELGLGWQLDRISNPMANSSGVFFAEQGTREAPYLRLQLEQKSIGEGAFSYNTTLSYNLRGLGTDERVQDLQLSADARYQLNADWAFGASLSAGSVKGLSGARTRTTDRFAPGGSTLRGFAHRGTGPADHNWRIGGRHYAAASLEVKRSVGEVLGAPAQIGVFADTGAAWGLDLPVAVASSKSRLRSSVGLSMTLDLGGVPLSAYVAKPVRKETSDKSQVFGLSVSFLR